MARNWVPDVALSLEKAQAIVESQFPEISHAPPTVLGRGWDNLCLLYDQDVVFRMPTREMGAMLLAHELLALPEISDRVPLAVPQFCWVGRPIHDYPYPFVAYRLLHGQTADSFDWTEKALAKQAVPIAHFLRALHSLPTNGALQELPGDELLRGDARALLRRIRTRLRTLVVKLDLVPTDQGQRILRWADRLAGQAVPTGDRCVVHGDFYARHLIADEALTITGVIDWGDVHLGQRGTDLSIAYSFLPHSTRAAFFEAYGPVSPYDHIIAQLAAANYGCSLLHYGHDTRCPQTAALGRDILGRLPL